MARRKRPSGPQVRYALTLRDQVGQPEASRISKATLEDPVSGRPIDAFAEVPDFQRPWHKPLVLTSLDGDDVSKLINALLDKAGRKGRRRNNR